MSSMAEMMDVFFNGRPARRKPRHGDLVEALRLLKGMHDKYHCKGCVCHVATFLGETQASGGTEHG